MKRLLLATIILTAVFSSCKTRNDRVVAQVYHYKLYGSELNALMPSGLAYDDSVSMANSLIEKWIKEKLVLHEAERKLSPVEKNFEKEMSDYRSLLLVSRYFERLWESDSAGFNITDNDIAEFSRSLDSRYTVEKEIVRVNYVKLPSNSPGLEKVKEILFNEEQRVERKQELAEMLADTVEYLIDDDAWIYLDDLQNEVAFEISPSESEKKIRHIERKVGDNTILLVILDYRSQRSVNETSEERAAAEMLLLNQRKTQFLNTYIDELYDRALKDGKIVQ
ncbi:MAG: hypothetical protein SPL42_07605 [Bacteroidales bacterium]|nr:hypothetical protein [Bacteroidales bacterium]MDY6348273.1 hypothetical protein [Bacteroidales bacterium]